ncbi:MAG: 4Fe-4S dicluster domain-containing protein [Desulfovibrionales bacterium]
MDSFPVEGSTAGVDGSRCDGCGLCIDSCPVEALGIVSNPKRPGKRIVRLDKKACLGCGMCQGTCPKEAIAVTGLGPGDLRRYVQQAIADCRKQDAEQQ